MQHILVLLLDGRVGVLWQCCGSEGPALVLQGPLYPHASCSCGWPVCRWA